MSSDFTGTDTTGAPILLTKSRDPFVNQLQQDIETLAKAFISEWYEDNVSWDRDEVEALLARYGYSLSEDCYYDKVNTCDLKFRKTIFN